MLESEGVDFQPFLPEDDVSLAERIDALSGWCEGYLYGLGMMGRPAMSRLDDEGREFVDDLAELSRLGGQSDEEVAADADEESYFEVVEYLRVGVLLVYASLARPDGRRMH